MRLLALDQASRTTGYAIFEDQQLIESGIFTLKDDDIGNRLVQYRDTLYNLIQEHKINELAFEDIQMQGQVNNVQTFKILAEIYGVTQELAAELKLPYKIISSNTWKSQLGIKGRTRAEQKKNAQQYVLDTFGLKASQDQSDAICLGASAIKKKAPWD